MVTRTRRWQLKNRSQGLCEKCGGALPTEPEYTWNVCERCYHSHRVAMARRRLKRRDGRIGAATCTTCGVRGHTKSSHDLAMTHPDLFPRPVDSWDSPGEAIAPAAE